MEKVSINEQNKSIATGPLYVHTNLKQFEFDLVTSALCFCKTPKKYLHIEKWCAMKCLLVRKMYSDLNCMLYMYMKIHKGQNLAECSMNSSILICIHVHVG